MPIKRAIGKAIAKRVVKKGVRTSAQKAALKKAVAASARKRSKGAVKAAAKRTAKSTAKKSTRKSIIREYAEKRSTAKNATQRYKATKRFRKQAIESGKFGEGDISEIKSMEKAVRREHLKRRGKQLRTLAIVTTITTRGVSMAVGEAKTHLEGQIEDLRSRL